MPRDGSGIYTTPVGTDGIPNRTISSTAYNLNVHDVEFDLNTPRPIIAGGTGAGDAPTALKNLGAMPKHDIGQCYLRQGATTTDPLTLKPENGNLIFINGNIETIPDAGLTLAPAGNSASTLYRIYAYMNSGVMTLEYSTTGYSVQAGTGVKIKTGDPTRKLVGLAISAGSNSTWSAYFTGVCSLYNAKDKTHTSPNATVSTSSASLTQIAPALDIWFATFGDREVIYKVFGRVNQTVDTAAAYLDAILDFSAPSFLFTSLQGAPGRTQPGMATSNYDWMHGELSFFVPDTALHTLTGAYATSIGTLTFIGNNSVTIKG